MSPNASCNAPCPVMILRNEQPITRIVLLLDGSASAEQAPAPGLAWRRRWAPESDPAAGRRSGAGDEKMAQLVRAEGRSPIPPACQTAGFTSRIRRSQHPPDLTINTALLDGLPAELSWITWRAKGPPAAMATHGHTGCATLGLWQHHR